MRRFVQIVDRLSYLFGIVAILFLIAAVLVVTEMVFVR